MNLAVEMERPTFPVVDLKKERHSLLYLLRYISVLLVCLPLSSCLPFSLCLSPSLTLSVSLSLSLSLPISLSVSFNLSVSLSVCLSASLSVSLTHYLFACFSLPFFSLPLALSLFCCVASFCISPFCDNDTITVLMFVNILIAMFSDTYTRIKDKEDVIFKSQKLELLLVGRDK